MKLYEKLKNREEKLALVGLGYVGMPIAVAFAKKGLDVIGFDLNREKIELYRSGVDPTKEVGTMLSAALLWILPGRKKDSGRQSLLL